MRDAILLSSRPTISVAADGQPVNGWRQLAVITLEVCARALPNQQAAVERLVEVDPDSPGSAAVGFNSCQLEGLTRVLPLPGRSRQEACRSGRRHPEHGSLSW